LPLFPPHPRIITLQKCPCELLKCPKSRIVTCCLPPQRIRNPPNPRREGATGKFDPAQVSEYEVGATLHQKGEEKAWEDLFK